MVSYRVQMVLKTVDGNPANFVTNTWATAAVTDFDAGNFVTSLVTFYNDIRTLYSQYIAQNNHVYKIYNMLDPEPRAPVAEGNWNFTGAPSGTSLPSECAMVLSFQAPKISGVNQGRRRGRVYIGPCSSTINDAGRPSSAAVTVLVAAADAHLARCVASGGDFDWAVYSTVNGGTATVTNGWVDNEWDTQRRRGRIATSRTTFN